MNGTAYHAFSQTNMSSSIPPPPRKQEVINPGLANNSSWNASPFAFAPNTNTLDAQAMPSDRAAAARAKSAAVMEALRSGEKGAADKAMGDNEGRSAAAGLTPLGGARGWMQKLKNRNGGKGKVEEEEK